MCPPELPDLSGIDAGKWGRRLFNPTKTLVRTPRTTILAIADVLDFIQQCELAIFVRLAEDTASNISISIRCENCLSWLTAIAVSMRMRNVEARGNNYLPP